MGPKRIMSEGCWFLALKIIKPTSGKRYFPLQVISANKVYLAKVDRSARKPGVDTFPDPVGHFGAPYQSFFILQAVRR